MNQSFKQVFVTNSGTLLASGTTSDLAVGQIGIFDGDNYVATTTPSYFKNKSLIVGWGYPDTESALMSGIFSENEKTKKINGRKIKAVRANKAVHGRSEKITLGWSGDVADTNSLTVKPGEKKAFYLRVTGSPIDRLYSTQGLIRRYVVEGDCVDPCVDSCESVGDAVKAAKNLVNQIQSDPKLKGLVKVTSQFSTPLVADASCYLFRVSVCDDGSDTALGYVQSQYPGFTATRVGRIAATSTYEINKDVNSAPAALSNAGLTIIPDCPSCPVGYTLTAAGFVYEIKRDDAGADATAAITASYAAATVISVTKLGASEAGTGTYILITTDETANLVGTDLFKAVGESRNSCVITSATTTAWALFDTLSKFSKTYTITLADSVCGTSRLLDLQAAYPDLVIAVVNAGGSCVHSFTTTILSNCVKPGCSIDSILYTAPNAFEGISWVEAPDAAGTGLSGLTLESAWVDRITNECTYGHWFYDADTVHIEISEFDADYNGAPEKCKLDTTAVKTIQSAVYAQGVGSYVRQLEEKSKEYFLKYRSFEPIVREIEGFSFQADPYKYYDEVQIDFGYDYPVGQFSERYTDNYTLTIFVQEGLAGNLVKAINNYITSPEINLDAVVI